MIDREFDYYAIIANNAIINDNCIVLDVVYTGCEEEAKQHYYANTGDLEERDAVSLREFSQGFAKFMIDWYNRGEN